MCCLSEECGKSHTAIESDGGYEGKMNRTDWEERKIPQD
jgi:hypothetical protein